MATKNFMIASRQVREVTVTLKYDDLEQIVTIPKDTRLITAVINTKTAFVTGTTEIDMGILGSLESILADVSVAAQGSAIPTTEWQQWGYETTAVTDIYITAGASNTAGEVDVTLILSGSFDTVFG